MKKLATIVFIVISTFICKGDEYQKCMKLLSEEELGTAVFKQLKDTWPKITSDKNNKEIIESDKWKKLSLKIYKYLYAMELRYQFDNDNKKCNLTDYFILQDLLQENKDLRSICLLSITEYFIGIRLAKSLWKMPEKHKEIKEELAKLNQYKMLKNDWIPIFKYYEKTNESILFEDIIKLIHNNSHEIAWHTIEDLIENPNIEYIYTFYKQSDILKSFYLKGSIVFFELGGDLSKMDFGSYIYFNSIMSYKEQKKIKYDEFSRYSSGKLSFLNDLITDKYLLKKTFFNKKTHRVFLKMFGIKINSDGIREKCKPDTSIKFEWMPKRK